MEPQDKTIVCNDCGKEFVHSVADQARYAERGFTNDPKRCRECREVRKAETAAANEGGKPLTCSDCGQEFIFSAKDQAYYSERGFSNDPKRCRNCREKHKAKMKAIRRTIRDKSGPPGRGPRPMAGSGGPARRPAGPAFGERQSFDAVCSECGVTTTVPFKPVSGRPVYCRDCFRARQASGR